MHGQNLILSPKGLFCKNSLSECLLNSLATALWIIVSVLSVKYTVLTIILQLSISECAEVRLLSTFPSILACLKTKIGTSIFISKVCFTFYPHWSCWCQNFKFCWTGLFNTTYTRDLSLE